MLIKLQVVCGSETNFTESVLKTLFKSQDKDYLLLVNHGELFLSPATNAYKRGSEESAAFLQASKGTTGNTDAHVFAIRVMNRDETNITGDLIELNEQSLHSNISRYAVMPDRIDAVFSSGVSKSYDLWDWAELPIFAKNDIVSYERHYPDNDLSGATKRYAAFVGANEMSSEAIGLDTFLSEMNTTYMGIADNPQSDMLRITNNEAKNILAYGDVDVFKLTPKGAEKLNMIEAAKPICFKTYQELAIKSEDISKLDKWAKREVNNIIQKNERDKLKKSKEMEEL